MTPARADGQQGNAKVEFPTPECRICGIDWCNDSTDEERFLTDRQTWFDHIVGLGSYKAIKGHVTARCHWKYGTGNEARVQADVRAMIGSWETRRELVAQQKIKDERAQQIAQETGRPVPEPGTVFEETQTAHEKYPSAFAGAQEPFGWEDIWTYCRCAWCTAKRERSA